MKISYVTVNDPMDINDWSGLSYSIAKMLENEKFELDYIKNLKVDLSFYMKLKNRFYETFSQKVFDLSREPFVSKHYARQIQKRIRPDTDIIFSQSSTPISCLRTHKPLVFYTDATFAGMLDFYEDFSNFSKETIRNGNILEQRALDNASLVIYSSDWAAESAVKNYKVEKNKIKVIPFGSNFNATMSYFNIKEVVFKREYHECHLLFIGVDWLRKGGDKALEVVNNLNILGLKTTLHVVGINKIPHGSINGNIINYGFLDKQNSKDISILNQLFLKCHFLILPTLADCTPVVYSEANSFGMPCVTTNVGGIPSIIEDNINGKLFSTDDNAKVYAKYIYNLFNDKAQYHNLCLSSYNESKTRLNWKTSGEKVKALLLQI